MSFTCPLCNGDGCEHCTAGSFDITSCPADYIGDDVGNVVAFADDCGQGMPPVAGGALDQCQSFVIARRFIVGECNYWKAKLKLIDF